MKQLLRVFSGTEVQMIYFSDDFYSITLWFCLFYFLFYLFIFWLRPLACGILVPQLGIKLVPSAV